MSLNGYINEIQAYVNALRREVEELKESNRDLKDILTHSYHHYWKARAKPVKPVDDLVEDLIQSSNQPDYLTTR